MDTATDAMGFPLLAGVLLAGYLRECPYPSDLPYGFRGSLTSRLTASVRGHRPG